MSADVFALGVIGARVQVHAPLNELAHGRIGTVTRVTRPQPRHQSTPAYVEIDHDGGRLIVSTLMLRPA